MCEGDAMAQTAEFSLGSAVGGRREMIVLPRADRA